MLKASPMKAKISALNSYYDGKLCKLAHATYVTFHAYRLVSYRAKFAPYQ